MLLRTFFASARTLEEALGVYTYEDVRKLVEEIRLMNRAKLILIKMRGMTETEAHRLIVRQAMDRCVRKRQISEEIIDYHVRYEERKNPHEGNSNRPGLRWTV